MEVGGYEVGQLGKGPLWVKGQQVPGERKGLAPLGQRWLIRSRGQTTAFRDWPCALRGEGLDSFPAVSAGTCLCSAFVADPLGV